MTQNHVFFFRIILNTIFTTLRYEGIFNVAAFNLTKYNGPCWSKAWGLGYYRSSLKVKRPVKRNRFFFFQVSHTTLKSIKADIMIFTSLLRNTTKITFTLKTSKRLNWSMLFLLDKCGLFFLLFGVVSK